MTALAGLLVRTTATRGRVAAIGAAGVVVVLLAVAILVGDGGASAARDLVSAAGLGLLLPVAAVVFATAVLGTPAEDGTLGYLLNTPQPRWRLALPAYGAAAVTVVPLTVVPLVTALVVNGVSMRTSLALVVAGGLGGLAYCAVFLALGVRFRRALLVGLGYSALWEGIVAGFGTGLARLSIRRYVESLLESMRGAPVPDAGVTGPVAAVVLVGLVLAGIVATTVALRTHVSRS